MSPATDHRAIVSPDSRGRFNLGRFMNKAPDLEFKVFVEDDGKTITLQAVVAK